MFLALLLAVAPPPVPDPTTSADGFPTQMQWDAALSCVRVSIKTGELATGTGVVVGHRDGFAYVLTAAHVVADLSDWELETFTRTSYPVPAAVHRASVVQVRRPDPDFALLKLPAPAPLFAARLAGPKQRPKAFPADALAVGCDDGRPPFCSPVQITARRLVRESAASDTFRGFFWETAEGAVRGRSGGPLFDRDGRVIGVCSGVKEATGRAYYTHLDEMLAALTTTGYAWLWDGK